MRIVVAPDSFKDCLSASVVAAILSDEISRQRPDIHVTECPLSDGGEGSLHPSPTVLPLTGDENNVGLGNGL